MFDRALKTVIDDAIVFLTANPSMLRRFIKMPGWTDDEVEKIVEAWNETGHGCKRPEVLINFGRAAGTMPAYAISMAGESEVDESLGRSEGAIDIEELRTLIEEVEAELGHTCSANVRRFQYTYQIFSYADTPDLTVALYNILKSVFLGADKRLVREFGFESPSFSGMDLSNDPRWLPDNAYARVWQVVGYAHVLTPVDFDAEPFIQRFSRIVGLHINNAVTGVDARLSPRAAP